MQSGTGLREIRDREEFQDFLGLLHDASTRRLDEQRSSYNPDCDRLRLSATPEAAPEAKREDVAPADEVGPVEQGGFDKDGELSLRKNAAPPADRMDSTSLTVDVTESTRRVAPRSYAIYLSVCFAVLFTAFFTVQNFLTSVFGDLAFNSLCVLYVALALSNLVAPKVRESRMVVS